jgi:hypothetical protein
MIADPLRLCEGNDFRHEKGERHSFPFVILTRAERSLQNDKEGALRLRQKERRLRQDDKGKASQFAFLLQPRCWLI